jgi:hypothetical protein
LAIFRTTALAFLFTSSALSSEGITNYSKNALKKELNSKITALKMEKFSKLKPKSESSKMNLETTTFDESNVHMRGLKMKDNFIVWTAFEDDQCMTPTMQSGSLVNYCMDEEGAESGGKRSYISKVNKKENLLVEIEYEGFGCKVIQDSPTPPPQTSHPLFL